MIHERYIITVNTSGCLALECRSESTFQVFNKGRAGCLLNKRSQRAFSSSNYYSYKIRGNVIYWPLTIKMDVPQLRRLVAGFPLRRSRFEPGSGHVGYMMDKAAMGQISFFRELRFPLSIIPLIVPHSSSIFIQARLHSTTKGNDHEEF
jgi:hypothetical protein